MHRPLSTYSGYWRDSSILPAHLLIVGFPSLHPKFKKDLLPLTGNKRQLVIGAGSYLVANSLLLLCPVATLFCAVPLK